MAQTFEEAFAEGPPMRQKEDRGTPLMPEEREFILWRWYRGDRHAKIARNIGVARSAVSSYRSDVRDCPSILTQVRLFVMGKGTAANSKRPRHQYLCLVCGRREDGVERSALQHVLNHYFGGFVRADTISIDAVHAYRARKALERRRRPKGEPGA